MAGKKMLFTVSQIRLLKELGTVINSGDNTYMYLPYWFKETDREDILEMFSLEDKLPEDLTTTIKNLRNDGKN